MSDIRKLAAVMFTDIAGYTSIMGEDEKKAHELVIENIELHKLFITQFNGKYIKDVGDSVIGSFRSATDAVGCAIAIQKSCLEKLDIKLHIGIHIGDIVFTENDLYGDGVNIAQRIQSISPPGTILISDIVRVNIQNKKDFLVDSVGEMQLKNVKIPVHVYWVKTGQEDEEAQRRLRKIAEKIPPFATWANFETEQFASSEVRQSLEQCKNREYLAVDNGVMLYTPLDFGVLHPEKIRIIIEGDLNYPLRIDKPNEIQRLAFAEEAQEDKIKAYLRQRAKKDTDYGSRAKVGIRKIVLPNNRVGQPLELRLHPLSYWTMDNFNRRMLDYPDDDILKEFKQDSLKEILACGRPIEFPCPSGFFVSVCIITSDQNLVLLQKNPSLSALARRGFRWTCTIEEGLEWKEVKDKVDLYATVKSGARKELEIKENEIDTIVFFGIALEHTHLNTSVLGYLRLNISSKELAPRIKKSDDFGLDHEFVKLNQAVDKLLLSKERPGDNWHPTARLRILLTMYHLNGAKKIREKLKKALQSDGKNIGKEIKLLP